MKRKCLLAWLTALWLVVPALLVKAEESEAKPAAKDAAAADEKAADGKLAAEGPKFVRVRRDADGKPLAMETAVVRYVPVGADREGLIVDLIGAIHVGDKAYYDELNKLFESYDVLLYELVAAEGTRVPKAGREGPSAHPVGAMQDGMSAILGLKHQLDSIDYTKANFVHADMSPEEFAKSMEKRGESFLQMFFRMMGQGMAQQAAKGDKAGSSDLDLLMALFSKDRATKLKLIFADQFEDLEGQMLAFDGPDGSTIITERNGKAFEVLDKQLKDGKKKIGVFYGAGHLPDMQRRLEKDFLLKRDSDQWLVAWELQKGKARAK